MNKLDKRKSPIAIEEEIEKTAKDIFDDFKQFTDGFRVLFLIQRHKEGGETNNSHLRKIVTRNSKEYLNALKELIRDKITSELPFRVYASLNERDFNKAIHKFKYEQLDADLFHDEQKQNFYLDVKNRFIGCLMQPSQRASSFFLFDIDKDDDIKDTTAGTLNVIPSEHIVKLYPTKNGWHLITKPFDYTKVVLPKNCEFKKDALILLSF